MDKNVLLNCLSTGKNLIESNAAFFAKKTDSKRFEQGRKLVRHFVGVSRAPDGNAVIEFEVPSRSDPSTVRHCFIDIIPKGTNLFTLSQTTKKLADRINTLKNADVRCYCSCPDFNWNGMKFMMKHKYDSLSSEHHADRDHDDHGEDIAPKVRTPALCAHLVAALGGILTNAGSIMKQVRTAPPVEETEPVEPTEQDQEHPMIGKNDSEKESNEVIEQSAEEHAQARNEAMEMFGGESQGIKTPETQEALNSLADNLEPSADEETEEVPEEENPMIGKYDAEKNSSPFIDYDEEASLPMFDVPVDEEETDQDEDLVIEEPQPLPKP